MREITTFECGRFKVQVTGAELVLLPVAIMGGTAPGLIGMTRQEARELSKALSLAADIVRTKRKSKAAP